MSMSRQDGRLVQFSRARLAGTSGAMRENSLAPYRKRRYQLKLQRWKTGGMTLSTKMSVVTSWCVALAMAGLMFDSYARAETPIALLADHCAVTPATNRHDLSSGIAAHECVSIDCDCHCCDHFGVNDCEPRFRLTEFVVYPTFSYLSDQSATYNEFEIASHTDLGFLEMENRTVLNVADLPSTIKLGPANPSAELLGPAGGMRANGFGDILSGFFFSRKGAHEQQTHLGLGPVLTFPTASNAQLGSKQYTAGPGIHFSTEFKRLTAGFFLWQSWGFGESLGQKKVSQLFGKPFVIYEVSEKWNLVYIPLGMSHSWDAPSGDNWTVPIGGGVRRLFEIHGQRMGLQFQAFDYVARKSKDPEWELRASIEFLFD